MNFVDLGKKILNLGESKASPDDDKKKPQPVSRAKTILERAYEKETGISKVAHPKYHIISYSPNSEMSRPKTILEKAVEQPQSPTHRLMTKDEWMKATELTLHKDNVPKRPSWLKEHIVSPFVRGWNFRRSNDLNSPSGVDRLSYLGGAVSGIASARIGSAIGKFPKLLPKSRVVSQALYGTAKVLNNKWIAYPLTASYFGVEGWETYKDVKKDIKEKNDPYITVSRHGAGTTRDFALVGSAFHSFGETSKKLYYSSEKRNMLDNFLKAFNSRTKREYIDFDPISGTYPNPYDKYVASGYSPFRVYLERGEYKPSPNKRIELRGRMLSNKRAQLSIGRSFITDRYDPTSRFGSDSIREAFLDKVKSRDKILDRGITARDRLRMAKEYKEAIKDLRIRVKKTSVIRMDYPSLSFTHPKTRIKTDIIYINPAKPIVEPIFRVPAKPKNTPKDVFDSPVRDLPLDRTRARTEYSPEADHPPIPRDVYDVPSDTLGAPFALPSITLPKIGSLFSVRSRQRRSYGFGEYTNPVVVNPFKDKKQKKKNAKRKKR